MTERKKQWLVRILIGGALGVAVLVPLGGVFNDIVSGGLVAMGEHTPFRLVSDNLEYLTGSAPLALAIQLALYFALGAVAGVATLPFADGGRALMRRSLAHFAVTAGLLTLTCTLLGWAWSWQAMAVYLVLLAAVYLLIWLGRWVGWYAELSAIRAKLGLAPGPSPLRWRETLPYLPFAALMCLLLPLALRWFLDSPIPLATAVYAGLALPVGGGLLWAVPGPAAGLLPGVPPGLRPVCPGLCAAGKADLQRGRRGDDPHCPLLRPAGQCRRGGGAEGPEGGAVR